MVVRKGDRLPLSETDSQEKATAAYGENLAARAVAVRSCRVCVGSSIRGGIFNSAVPWTNKKDSGEVTAFGLLITYSKLSKLYPDGRD